MICTLQRVAINFDKLFVFSSSLSNCCLCRSLEKDLHHYKKLCRTLRSDHQGDNETEIAKANETLRDEPNEYIRDAVKNKILLNPDLDKRRGEITNQKF